MARSAGLCSRQRSPRARRGPLHRAAAWLRHRMGSPRTFPAVPAPFAPRRASPASPRSRGSHRRSIPADPATVKPRSRRSLPGRRNRSRCGARPGRRFRGLVVRRLAREPSARARSLSWCLSRRRRHRRRHRLERPPVARGTPVAPRRAFGRADPGTRMRARPRQPRTRFSSSCLPVVHGPGHFTIAPPRPGETSSPAFDVARPDYSIAVGK